MLEADLSGAVFADADLRSVLVGRTALDHANLEGVRNLPRGGGPEVALGSVAVVSGNEVTSIAPTVDLGAGAHGGTKGTERTGRGR